MLKHTTYSIRIVAAEDWKSPAIRGLGKFVSISEASDYFLPEQIPEKEKVTEVIAVSKELPYAPDKT